VGDAWQYLRAKGFGTGLRFYFAALLVFVAFRVWRPEAFVPALVMTGLVALLGLITHVLWLLTKLKL
jgi:hypothetical protein